MYLLFFRQYYKIVDITKSTNSYGFFFFFLGHYILGMFAPNFISHPLL